jgi:hypothetical protein
MFQNLKYQVPLHFARNPLDSPKDDCIVAILHLELTPVSSSCSCWKKAEEAAEL